MNHPAVPSSPIHFRYWPDPSPEAIGHNVAEFLAIMGQPTHIHLSGKDNQRSRVVVTLLHGNEPSGLMALFHLLKHNIQPAVDIHCLIPNIAAAIEPPGFSNRALPGKRDLNRCFKPPYEHDAEGQLAKAVLNLIRDLNPECVIDIHNTSGSGPSFGVTTFMDARHDALVSLFTQRVIVTDLRLGALMEISETLCPTVTIECGGAQDKESALMAQEGLMRYMTESNVLQPHETDFGLEFFSNPVRLELTEAFQVDYGEGPSQHPGVTLKTDIEHHNFGGITRDTLLGYVQGTASDMLTAKNTQGEEQFDRFFRVEGNRLFPAQDLRLFMITSNPLIAKTDCLFYLVPADH